MGITRVANVTGLDSIGIPVVIVSRPNSRSLAVSQGKGLNLASAKASGIMESIESYHAEHITLPLKYGSYEELNYTHRLVDVERLPKISGGLYHPNLKILWIEGYDIIQDELVWIPYEMVHTDYTLPLPVGSGCFPITSNGLASGNHFLEAVSHGICEVVERDSTTLWRYFSEEKKLKSRINLNTVDHVHCLRILEKYKKANIEVAVWDTTTDVGIPSFLCTIIGKENNPLRPLYSTSGMGCHPVRHIALLRALTEAAQSRLTFIAGSRDDAIRGKYERYLNQDIHQYFRKQLEIKGPLRKYCEIPTWESKTLNEDVSWEISKLTSAGLKRVIVVDLTKSEFDIPVVRVVIPGLESTDEALGYEPGIRVKKQLENST
ncbi:ribosomal protein S12 methylthiotransferase accessory factor [Fodinibius roseus]|uniref:Ribosomal protein S12 methylthiotransferase accessory factor n=2 Tax=Fodinibius roseus TaxID=1194090 RepID=A0A1M5G430_9BACT|nr:ribosomal protein S12 methylthiotransferase accessory factor [Fodinibius roseus]